MTLRVTLPTIDRMKMEFKSYIELQIPSESFTLPEIKAEIFKKAWEVLEVWSPNGIHGKPDDVILRNRYDQEITNDLDLKERINKSENFSAVFKSHTNGRL